jgi:hypothetical protein
MEARFDGLLLFGEQTRVIGPIPRNRQQREILPGVAGFRVYRLGTDSVIWQVRGRLVASTLANLETLLMDGANYVDGQLYDFQTTGGNIFGDCLLNDFRPVEEIQAGSGLILGSWASIWTVEVGATVEWASPLA